MEFKGTKGRWKANNEESYYNGYKDTFKVNYGVDGECVCEVVHGFDNAKLIAAAPELLEACIEFVRKCDDGEAKSVRSYKQMSEAIKKALD